MNGRYKLRVPPTSLDQLVFILLESATVWGTQRLDPVWLSVDIPAVSDLDDSNNLLAVVHLKQDSKLPLPKSKPVLSGEFFAALWPRFIREVLNLADDSAPVLGL